MGTQMGNLVKVSIVCHRMFQYPNKRHDMFDATAGFLDTVTSGVGEI